MIKKKKKKIIFFSDRFFFVFVFVDIHFSSYISSKMLFFVSVRNPLCLIESSCKSKEVDVHFAFELKMNSILIKKDYFSRCKICKRIRRTWKKNPFS